MDRDGSAELLGFASLQLGIYGVFNDGWQWGIQRLTNMPGSLGVIQLGGDVRFYLPFANGG